MHINNGYPRSSGTILKFIILALDKSKLLKISIGYHTCLISTNLHNYNV